MTKTSDAPPASFTTAPSRARPPRSPRRGALLAALAAGSVTFALLLATTSMLPMSWDEGNAIHRAQGIQHWAGTLGKKLARGQPAPFSADAIARDWRYTTQIDGHPALYGEVIALGRSASPSWLAPLTRYRLGPMLLFALATSAFCYRLWREFSPLVAVTGTFALVTMPRLFAHAHFASFDGPLTSCWMLAWAAFAPAMRGRCPVAVPWGLALGMTMSCKFTGWLAIYPFLLFAAAHASLRALRNVALGVVCAIGTFHFLNPPLWHQPLASVEQFFELNLNRRVHGLNIPTTFFGNRHDLDHPLPWYNGFFWLGVTVPSGTVCLALVGMAAAARGRQGPPGAGLLLLANCVILPLVRATPWAPPHDAERLILCAFPFLAALAGMGASAVWHWVARRYGPRGRKFATAGVALWLAGSASSLAWYAPQWLSYYNLAIGGLRGATALGMEPTYYWDALDGEVLGWLHAHTAPGTAIAIGAGSSENLDLLREWGVIRRGCLTHPTGSTRWYVLQRRPSFYSDVDRVLIAHERPVFQKTIRAPTWGLGPWRLDVPLVEVYSARQYERASK